MKETTGPQTSLVLRGSLMATFNNTNFVCFPKRGQTLSVRAQILVMRHFNLNWKFAIRKVLMDSE
jgi:hypothetical protein